MSGVWVVWVVGVVVWWVVVWWVVDFK